MGPVPHILEKNLASLDRRFFFSFFILCGTPLLDDFDRFPPCPLCPPPPRRLLSCSFFLSKSLRRLPLFGGEFFLEPRVRPLFAGGGECLLAPADEFRFDLGWELEPLGE